MSRKRLIQIGIVGVLVVVLVGFAYFLTGTGGSPAPSSATAPQTPSTSDDEPAVPTDAQNARVMRLVAEARQLAGDARFTEAEADLQKAEKVIPGSPEVAAARREIAAMQTPAGQLATQLNKARLAIDHGDYSAADTALANAERLNAQSPEIAELRQALKTAQTSDTRRANRITEHLTAMREAIARHDFAAADSELDAASRIDVEDPRIGDARRELARARSAFQKGDGERK